MNTQNVKTAASESSERWGNNTNVLIRLVEFESELMGMVASNRLSSCEGRHTVQEQERVEDIAETISGLIYFGDVKTPAHYQVIRDMYQYGTAVCHEAWTTWLIDRFDSRFDETEED